jgi:hypothetical protein
LRSGSRRWWKSGRALLRAAGRVNWGYELER